MSDREQDTTISIATTDKKRLDGLKMHRREPYKEVIHRILDDIEKMSQSGVRFPSLPPRTYTSYIKALIDSKTQVEDQ